MSEPAQLLSTAIEAARLAGALLKERFTGPRTIEQKDGLRVNLVTDADKASEAALIAFLGRRYPTHAVLAEESGASTQQGDFRWFIDPLDGTTNYAHQVPHYCVTLAVEGPVAGQAEPAVLAGVVYDPMLDELFAAARGQGATLNGRRLQTSKASSLEQALMCTGFPYDLNRRPEVPLGLFNRLVRRVQGVRRMGSAALDLAYVAAGRFDGFFEFGLKPWDTAAGALLIEEAGGRMTRIDGSPYRPRFPDVLGAGALLHPVLAAECGAFVRELGWQPTVD